MMELSKRIPSIFIAFTGISFLFFGSIIVWQSRAIAKKLFGYALLALGLAILILTFFSFPKPC
jgi:hypothetical protein